MSQTTIPITGFAHTATAMPDAFKDFVVLKGIEYDTIDAGHILVIMPENVKLLILECRGLPVKMLQDIVTPPRRYSWAGTPVW